tara:strand:- start:14403 stop:14507 length:105 start_codon:yes stop_codon:yes gene_type:complete
MTLLVIFPTSASPALSDGERADDAVQKTLSGLAV